MESTIPSGHCPHNHHHYSEHFTLKSRPSKHPEVLRDLVRSAKSAARVKCFLFPRMKWLYLVIFKD